MDDKKNYSLIITILLKRYKIYIEISYYCIYKINAYLILFINRH